MEREEIKRVRKGGTMVAWVATDTIKANYYIVKRGKILTHDVEVLVEALNGTRRPCVIPFGNVVAEKQEDAKALLDEKQRMTKKHSEERAAERIENMLKTPVKEFILNAAKKSVSELAYHVRWRADEVFAEDYTARVATSIKAWMKDGSTMLEAIKLAISAMTQEQMRWTGCHSSSKASQIEEEAHAETRISLIRDLTFMSHTLEERDEVVIYPFQIN